MPRILAGFIFIIIYNFSFSQNKRPVSEKLRLQLLESTKKYKATIGIGLINIEDGDTLSINNKHHYPMQSVYKFPLALAVLHEVDEQRKSLTQIVHVSKEDLRPKTWSPLRKKFPEGNVDLTLAEVLEYSVSQSDNNCCDILFRLMNGTGTVDKYIHSLGIKGIAIAATEEEMARGWEVQYTNWAEPFAMAELLKGFYKGKYLSGPSNMFLVKLMVESSNSANRIKGLLPADITVAHKTGTSDTNEKGVTAAVNDVGIITLPNGKHIALAVFVSDTTESSETGEKIIATVSKIIFDFYAGSKN